MSGRQGAGDPLDAHLRGLRARSLDEGDGGAAGELLMVFEPYARAIFARLGLAADDRDEAFQDLATQVLRDDLAVLRGWRGEGSLRAYLAVVASRVALRIVTEHARRAPGAYEPAPVEEVADRGIDADPASRAGDRLLLAAVARALSSLGPRDRELLRRRHLGEQRYREIGAAMGMTVNHVGVALWRAEQRLGRALGELGLSRRGAADPAVRRVGRRGLQPGERGFRRPPGTRHRTVASRAGR